MTLNKNSQIELLFQKAHIFLEKDKLEFAYKVFGPLGKDGCVYFNTLTDCEKDALILALNESIKNDELNKEACQYDAK